MDRLTTQDDLQAGARWAPALRALGDERLARMVEGGSEPAFAAIYGRYAPVLHGYCRSLLRDEEEAGDALQNAMLKALQALRRAGRSGPLRPWLFRIAHNESVTILRARTRRPGPLDDSMVAGAGDAFRSAAAREQLAALLEGMQHLTEHQRGALVMRELGGLTYDEIGVALETTPLAARQAVFAARKRLRDGVVPPRRLRPALRQLIPAPGFALFGLLGGGGGAAFTAGKALIGTAAAVSVGIGSVELAATPADRAPSRQARTTVAVTPEHHRAHRVAKAATTEPATPRLRVRTVAAAATPAATVPARTQSKVAAVETPAPSRTSSASRGITKSETETISHPTHGAPAPADATPAPAAPVTDRPPEHQRPAYPPPSDPVAYDASAERSDHRDCPPGGRGVAPADDTASPSASAVPVVQ